MEVKLKVEITETGVHIPVLPGIYNPILDRLEEMEIRMVIRTPAWRKYAVNAVFSIAQKKLLSIGEQLFLSKNRSIQPSNGQCVKCSLFRCLPYKHHLRVRGPTVSTYGFRLQDCG